MSVSFHPLAEWEDSSKIPVDEIINEWRRARRSGADTRQSRDVFWSIWAAFLVDFGSEPSLFEVFKACENLYYASWTHVTSLDCL